MYSYLSHKKQECNKTNSLGQRPCVKPRWAPQAVSHTLAVYQKTCGKDVIQRVTDDNPYSMNDGKTGHHIIPHSLLNSIMDKIDTESQEELKKMFIPDINTLTLRQLHNIKAIKIVENAIQISGEEVPAVSAFLKKSGADEPIGRGLRVFINSFIDNKFPDDDNTSIKITKDNPSIQNSFYEWQKGNQFLAIRERAEAGAFSEFDEDGRFFYDDDYVSKLKSIYLILNQLDLEYKTVSKNYNAKSFWVRSAKKHLTELAQLTADVPKTATDADKKWVTFPADTRTIFNESFLPAKRMRNLEFYPNILKDYADEMILKRKVQLSIDAILALSDLLDKIDTFLFLESSNLVSKEAHQISEKINLRYNPMVKAYNIYKTKNIYLNKANNTFWEDIDTLVRNMKQRQEYNFKELREKAKRPQLIYQDLSSYLPVMQNLVDKL